MCVCGGDIACVCGAGIVCMCGGGIVCVCVEGVLRVCGRRVIQSKAGGEDVGLVPSRACVFMVCVCFLGGLQCVCVSFLGRLQWMPFDVGCVSCTAPNLI